MEDQADLEPTTDDAAEQNGRRMTIGTLEKAFRVLTAFDKHNPSLGLVRLSEAAGIDISSAQRITHTLTKMGYLQKDPSTRAYSTTLKCLSIGYHFLTTNRFIDKSTPYLVHLSQETDETVNLTMLDDTDVVIVGRILSRHILNTSAVIGTRLPAFCTAPGIALLSKLPPHEAADIIERSEIRPYTSLTTLDRPKILEKIDKARSDGFAVSTEEFMHNDLSVAAAIMGPEGRPQGAINIAAPRSGSAQDQVGRYSSLVMRVANAISVT